MKRILLLMSFIGAGYAASCETLPPSLVKSLTDSGKNGAQYVLIVNKYDSKQGYYADVWAFDGKELKHANHVKDVDVNKILGAGTTLVGGKEATTKVKQDKDVLTKDLAKLKKDIANEKKAKTKKTKKNYEQEVAKDKKALEKDKAKLEKDIKETKSKAKIKNTKAAKKQLDEAQTDYKKTGEAIKKAKTEAAKKTARAAHARSGKALIKAENALK